MIVRLAAETIFWSSVIALGYTYAGYPLLLALVSTIRPRRVRRGEFQTTVSIIITAYNEERDLKDKLDNTLALDYPRELIETIVASDCSTDRTDEIAREYAANTACNFIARPSDLGRPRHRTRQLSRRAARSFFFPTPPAFISPIALRAIMPSFADTTVGCVAGRLIYVDGSNSQVGKGARSYWGYERFLKRHESRIGSLIGASGCLYAVRRSAYVPLYHEACSDFIIATKMVEQNLRAVYEPEAVCTEETNRQGGKELKMRVRIIAQTLNDLWRHRVMLNPFHSGFYAVQLLSHKVMRYLVPFLLVALFIASALLSVSSISYRLFFVIQLVGYACPAFAWILNQVGIRSRLIAFPQYFILANLASLIACYQFLRGERYARWEPIRESRPRPVPGFRCLA